MSSNTTTAQLDVVVIRPTNSNLTLARKLKTLPNGFYSPDSHQIVSKSSNLHLARKYVQKLPNELKSPSNRLTSLKKLETSPKWTQKFSFDTPQSKYLSHHHHNFDTHTKKVIAHCNRNLNPLKKYGKTVLFI